MPETTHPFPPEINQDVEGLSWLGHLEQEVKFAGHTFLLRTPKAGEELEASLIAKEYLDSLGQVKANSWAQLAAALVAVDGDFAFCPPIGPDNRQHVRAKFNFMIENWYHPVADYLFTEYVQLLRRQAEAIQAVEDLSSRSLNTSWRLPDSLIDQVPSQED